MKMDFLTVEEILADESFYQWQQRSNAEAIRQWDEWTIQPANKALAQEAILLLNQISLTEAAVPTAQVDAALQKLRANLSEAAPARVVPIRRRHWWLSAAAAAILILAGVFAYRQYNFGSEKIQTQFGQIKQQLLPDGSEVTLNAHSNVSFSKAWTEEKDREIWLDGEAFFHVKKTKAHSRFIVHTSRFDIIVTGTQFNAVNRDGITSVTLKEGSVIVRTKDGKQVIMTPGQFVEVRDESMKQETAQIDKIIAWKDRKMSFNNTTMRDAACMISAHYGVKVVLANEATASRTINGIMPNDNLDALLEALELTTDFTIEKEDNRIVINHQP